jgi:hypothetical protein
MRLLLLFLIVLFCGYSQHRAEKNIERIRINESQTQLKQEINLSRTAQHKVVTSHSCDHPDDKQKTPNECEGSEEGLK